jgi:outer membrane protein
MKHILLFLLLLAACASRFPAAAAEQKLAVVDLKKIFEDYYKTRIANAKLQDELAELEKERKAMLEDYKRAGEDHKKALNEANDQAVSADERERRKKTAEAKLIEMNEIEQRVKQFDRTAIGNLEERKRQAHDKIVGEIRAVINAKARAGGWQYVLDAAAESQARTPILLYSDGASDLTGDVLKQLNANAPTDLPALNGKKDEKK